MSRPSDRTRTRRPRWIGVVVVAVLPPLYAALVQWHHDNMAGAAGLGAFAALACVVAYVVYRDDVRRRRGTKR